MRIDPITKEVTLTEIEYHELINRPKVQTEADLEKAARYVYESWMGGTMNDVCRDMAELGKVLNARKEE